MRIKSKTGTWIEQKPTYRLVTHLTDGATYAIARNANGIIVACVGQLAPRAIADFDDYPSRFDGCGCDMAKWALSEEKLGHWSPYANCF